MMWLLTQIISKPILLLTNENKEMYISKNVSFYKLVGAQGFWQISVVEENARLADFFFLWDIPFCKVTIYHRYP